MTIRTAGLVMITLGLIGLGTAFIDWQANSEAETDETAIANEATVDEITTLGHDESVDEGAEDATGGPQVAEPQTGQETDNQVVDVAVASPDGSDGVTVQPPGNVKIFERDGQPDQKKPILWASIAAASDVINEDSGHANFLVTLSEPADHSVVIIFSTIDLSAQDQEDYQSQRGTVTFEPGVVSAEIRTPLVDDDIKEDDEEFAIILNGAPGIVQFKSRRITATIRDND